MRVPVIAVACSLLVATPAFSQQKQPRANPETGCRKPLQYDTNYLDFYFRAVYDSFEPPDWKKSLIRIRLEAQETLLLWTDGERFKLWTYSSTPRNINKYLFDLGDSCRLPNEPSLAAGGVKIKWESADLPAAQFAQIHLDLTHALSQYVSNAQERYDPTIKTKLSALYLDSVWYRIGYRNSYEDIEVEAVEDPKQFGAIVDWVYNLQKLAEASFRRPFGVTRRIQ